MNFACHDGSCVSADPTPYTASCCPRCAAWPMAAAGVLALRKSEEGGGGGGGDVERAHQGRGSA